MNKFDKGWHEVNWTPLPEPEYDDDKIVRIIWAIVCVVLLILSVTERIS